VAAGVGSGDVVGPALSTDNALVRFDGTTGKLLQNSNAALSDTGDLVLVGGAQIGGSFVRKTHSGYAGSSVTAFTAAGQTTNTSGLNLVTITLADNTTYWFKSRVAAREVNGTDRAVYERTAMIYRNNGGAATFGTAGIQANFTDESAGAVPWTATFTVSGNNVNINVSGAAATTINWVCMVEYQGVSTSA
jgi:hypothetical protein